MVVSLFRFLTIIAFNISNKLDIGSEIGMYKILSKIPSDETGKKIDPSVRFKSQTVEY